MSSSEPDPLPPAYAPPRRGCLGGCFHIFLTSLCVLGIGAVAVVFVGPPAILEFVKFQGGKLKDRLVTQTIQDTFRQHTAKIASTNGNILEVATKETSESFDRKTQLQLGGVAIPFFDNTVTQKTRATYRYHIKLDGRWELRPERGDEGTLIVISPLIEPTLPVAFDSKAMESEVKGYWVARYHQELNLEELRKELTQKLEQRARSQENIDSVRDASRRSVALFVKNWIDEGRTPGIRRIKVIFPDEEQKDTEAFPVTLEVGSGILN
jgi:hypothetical protein